MFPKLLLAIALLGAIYFFLRWFARTPPEKVGQILRRGGFTLFLIILVFLALTGRLNWIFALLAALIPWIQRGLGLLRFLPFVRRLYQHFRGGDAHAGSQGPGGAGAGSGQRAPPGGDAMNAAEAYEILGLQPGASRDDIIAAHRRLMHKLHPDRGGNDWLASRLNQARDHLLEKLGG